MAGRYGLAGDPDPLDCILFGSRRWGARSHRCYSGCSFNAFYAGYVRYRPGSSGIQSAPIERNSYGDQEVKRASGFSAGFHAAILAGILPMRRDGSWLSVDLWFCPYCTLCYLTTGRNDGNHDEDLRCCYFAPRQDEPGLNVVVLQVLAALAVIIAGAHTFVGAVTEIAEVYRVPAFALSIIIAPIATELPEKFNSVI